MIIQQKFMDCFVSYKSMAEMLKTSEYRMIFTHLLRDKTVAACAKMSGFCPIHCASVAVNGMAMNSNVFLFIKLPLLHDIRVWCIL